MKKTIAERIFLNIFLAVFLLIGSVVFMPVYSFAQTGGTSGGSGGSFSGGSGSSFGGGSGTSPTGPGITTPTTPSTSSTLHFKYINPLLNTNDLTTLVTNILNAVAYLLAPVVTIMLLYSGFLFVTAQGNTEKLGTAKKALTYALIGAVLVLGAKGFSLVVQNAIQGLAKP